MKKIVYMTISILVVASMICGIVSATQVPFGPAPNAGDGDPDGSGMPAEPWANDGAPDAVGPAPNSGDGVPDGSGF